jgi:flagellar L-ring protein precursor FlgH
MSYSSNPRSTRRAFPPATLAAVGVVLAATVLASAACADGGLFVRMYGDRRAQGIGDTLHLIIAETSSASMNAGEGHQKSSETTVGPGTGYLDFIKALGFSGSSNSSAKGSSSRDNKMSARMTVRIVQITDAGNFVVEGERTVVVNKDHETIKIRGEVRPRDITPDNAVYSYNLANVQIDYLGTDPQKPGRKAGIITQILNFLF